MHRRMVREAIGSALPRPRKKPERPRWKLKAAVEFVDAILDADRKAPRKQRHTAHRIWTRMQNELPECKIAERTVREYVHDRKIVLGLMVREICVPQSYAWGVEAQVDWYEAYADLAGERTKCRCSGCAAWPAEPASTAPTCMRRSRRFWKPTSWHSPTLAAYSTNFAMTTSPLR